MDRIPLSDEAADPTDDLTDDQFDTPAEVELAFDRYLEQRDDELEEEQYDQGRDMGDLELEPTSD